MRCINEYEIQRISSLFAKRYEGITNGYSIGEEIGNELLSDCWLS